MSFPPYPQGFNTFYNHGYKQFWGSGFPYVKDDFVGGISGLQYHTDDEHKVRIQPVMDLQNISTKKGGRKITTKGGCMDCKDGSKKGSKEGGKKRSKKGSKEGRGADPDLLKKVQAYKKENNVSLKEAWDAVHPKEGRTKTKKTKSDKMNKEDIPTKLQVMKKVGDLMLKCEKQKKVISNLDKARKQAEKAEQKYDKSIMKSSKSLQKDYCGALSKIQENALTN